MAGASNVGSRSFLLGVPGGGGGVTQESGGSLAFRISICLRISACLFSSSCWRLDEDSMWHELEEGRKCDDVTINGLVDALFGSPFQISNSDPPPAIADKNKV